jgi:hypothetical protein
MRGTDRGVLVHGIGKGDVDGADLAAVEQIIDFLIPAQALDGRSGGPAS